MRPVLEPFFAVTRLDLRAASWRLDVLRTCHAELSAISFLGDSPGAPNERLIDLVAPVVEGARKVKMSALAARQAPAYVHIWPGEHYRLLVALVEHLKPLQIIDIGTYTGLSALSMLSAMPEEAHLITVDVLPWSKIPETCLMESDFSSGRLRQIVCDLGIPAVAEEHAPLLRDSDIILIDGPKDGVFEQRLLGNLAAVGLKPGALLILDDVRLWNMLEVWRNIAHPKLDLTSLGHWSGTGLVDWGGGAALT